MEAVTLAVTEILIGERVRKDMGDITSLAESIQRHGLLHPVVIKSDRTLVAGHRRLEAVRSLAWTDIPVTIIDVADLLSAERDENAERKDFTPTEAVAIGRLIEEQERPRATANKILGAQKSVALRSGNDVGNLPTSYIDLREVAGNAVGMSGTSYGRAKAVVAAAEADPVTFGDLPQQMDETGNINGTHNEMKRRQGRPAPNARHAVHYRAPYPKRDREMERAITALDGICTCLEAIPTEELDASRCNTWSKSLKKSVSTISRFARTIDG